MELRPIRYLENSFQGRPLLDSKRINYTELEELIMGPKFESVNIVDLSEEGSYLKPVNGKKGTWAFVNELFVPSKEYDVKIDHETYFGFWSEAHYVDLERGEE
jgi:hypothetical protein